MFRLYGKQEGKMYYAQFWEEPKRYVQHIGELGEVGRIFEYKKRLFHSAFDEVEHTILCLKSKGFREFPTDELHKICIEYPISEKITESEILKRYAVETILRNSLQSVGLVESTAGISEDDRMIVQCDVVNYHLSESIILTELSQNNFSDFSRFYHY